MRCHCSKIGKIIVCALHSNQFFKHQRKNIASLTCVPGLHAALTKKKRDLKKKQKKQTLIWMLLLLVTVAALRNVVVFVLPMPRAAAVLHFKLLSQISFTSSFICFNSVRRGIAHSVSLRDLAGENVCINLLCGPACEPCCLCLFCSRVFVHPVVCVSECVCVCGSQPRAIMWRQQV